MDMSTATSANAVDLAAGVSDCSPVVNREAEPVGGVIEEEAIGNNGNKKIKRKEERRENRFKFLFLSPSNKPKVL